jgi:IS5 family transposase
MILAKQMMIDPAGVQLERLSKLGDPLERINAAIDWEIFRLPIVRRIRKEDYSKGGRPPTDEVLIFKMALLSYLNNTGDDATEYLINDRLSFQRFLGLELGEKSPDAKTLWLFKEKMGSKGMRELFDLFNEKLTELGVIKREGSLIDASFVEVPRQRNSREDNKTIKAGQTPENWLPNDDDDKDTKAQKNNRLEQKDTEARWAKKGNQTFYGYKDHVKADNKTKVIIDFSVTPANVHDINEFEGIIDANDKEAWLDSAYASADHIARIMEAFPNIILHINEKGTKSSPLTYEQKESNRQKSKTRARVEHIFGYITRFMGGMTIRTIGITRATREIAGKNLAYNIRRIAFLHNAKKISKVA